MRHIAILRYQDLATAEPSTQRNLDVFQAPAAHSGIHLSLVPPELACGKHTHGDGRVVVLRRPSAPSNVQTPCEGRRGSDPVGPRSRFILLSIQVEVQKVHESTRILRLRR